MAIWAMTIAVIIMTVVIMYYRKKYKVTRVVNEGGRSIIQISQDADSENIMMGIFYGPYDDRLPFSSVIPAEALEEEEPMMPQFEFGREFWNKVCNIRSIKDDDEAFAVARRLVEMKVIPEEDVPSFLGLDGENRRPKVETADEESTSGPMPVQEEEDSPAPSAAGSAAAPSQEPEKESEQVEQVEQKEEPEKPRPSAPAYSVQKPSDKGAERPEAVPVDNWAALEKFFNEDMDF